MQHEYSRLVPVISESEDFLVQVRLLHLLLGEDFYSNLSKTSGRLLKKNRVVA